MRTREYSVCLGETLGGCTRVNWGRSGVPQRNVNTLYRKNNFDIPQEVWAISVDVQAWWPSPSPSSPPPQANTTLKKTQGKHAGPTGNRQQRRQPTAKLRLSKTNVCARRVYTRRGPKHNSRQRIHVRSRVSDKSARHRSTHCSANRDWVLIGNKNNVQDAYYH